jgi:hypothetical protein
MQNAGIRYACSECTHIQAHAHTHHTHPQNNTLCSMGCLDRISFICPLIDQFSPPLPFSCLSTSSRSHTRPETWDERVARQAYSNALLDLLQSSSLVVHIWFDLTLCFSAGTECARQPAHLVSAVLLTQVHCSTCTQLKI